MAKKRGLATDKGLTAMGERLAALRKARGITQVEMAELLGVTQSVVSHYEGGLLRLHGELIVRLAEILRVSADELLGIRAPTKTPRVPDNRLGRRFRELAKLPPRQRRHIVQVLDSLLDAERVRTTARVGPS